MTMKEKKYKDFRRKTVTCSKKLYVAKKSEVGFPLGNIEWGNPEI